MTPVDVVAVVFNLTPRVGDESAKIAVTMQLRMLFKSTFPKEPPVIEILTSKGIEDDQLEEIQVEFKNGLANHCNEEVEEIDGVLYNIWEDLREIISGYNDTLRGRCSVCLDPFAKNEEELESGKFTDRKDLVRVDECFHRFHLLCVYRYWYMRRHVETDEFGNKIEYKVPDEKLCPVCRRKATTEDVSYIETTFKADPNL